MTRRILPAALAALALAGASAGPAQSAETPVTTVRPTGVGLPIIGVQGGVDAGNSAEMVAALRAYHDSGRYERDLWQVARAARRSLVRQVARLPRGARPAIVLDIDETALSNWATLSASDFGAKPVPEQVQALADGGLAATRAVYRSARAHGVAVFFVTGRSPAMRDFTFANLRAAGYPRWSGAFFRPAGQPTIPFKAGARARIERGGHTILVNVGDQQSDLQGGHARRAFKLPNPFYFIG